MSNYVVRTPFRTRLIWGKRISFRLRAYGYLAATGDTVFCLFMLSYNHTHPKNKKQKTKNVVSSWEILKVVSMERGDS